MADAVATVTGPPDERRRTAPRPTSAFLGVIVALAAAAAIAVVRDVSLLLVVVPAAVGLAAPFAGRLFRRLGATTTSQRFALAALYLGLTSTLVLRQRSAAAIADDPLDGAGIFRVLALGGAGACAALALLFAGPLAVSRVPRFVKVYGAYTGVAAIGVIVAVSPAIVAFRAVELAIFLLVFLAGHAAFRGRTTVLLRNFMFFVWGLMASAVVSFLRSPSRSLAELNGDQRLKGLNPYISADILGILGSLSFAYGLGQPRVRWGPTLAGVAIVVAAQHRTGYLAIGAILVVRLVLTRRSGGFMLAVGLLTIVLAVAGSGVVAEQWSRGQTTEQVGTFSSRTLWWSDGLEALGRSPVVGLGLTSGARYEVFAERQNVDTPNLHGGWVEALVGVGVLGLLLLVASYLTATFSAWRTAVRWRFYAPVLLLVALGVNSFTHSTFEFGGLFLLGFLLAGASARQPVAGVEGERRRLSISRHPPLRTVPRPIGSAPR